MLAGLAPARRRVVLGLFALLLAAVVAGVALVVPRLTTASAGQTRQSLPGPVLLVPGYGGATGALEDLAHRLRTAGRDVTVVRLPGDGTGDLRAAAGVLQDAVEGTLERTGADSVDVVGYSAGGVVARLWAADGGGTLARRIITLGSPHHGTAIADLAGGVLPDECPAGCQQLATGSDLLRQLNAEDETPPGPTWVSIWTTQDQTVEPPDSARLDGALNLPVQSVCADARVGHPELPRSPLVQAMVLTELRSGPPVPLGPRDCARLRAASD